LAGVPDWPLIWIKARLLLLAARLLLLATAVPDQEIEYLALGVFGAGALERDRGHHLVAAAVECEPPQQ
jgi:hypothetical protein